MKKYIIGFCLSIIAVSSYAFADLGGFVIDAYNVNMNLHTNGSMDITETLTMNFTEQRHGIYREIPVKDPNGDYIHLKDINVIGDSIADLSLNDTYYTIKIGSADSYVYGVKTYTIVYTVENAVKAFTEFTGGTTGTRQELYWNVIGHSWNTTINKPTFTLTIPKEYGFSGEDMFIVRGAQGSQNNTSARIQQVGTSSIAGIIQDTLQPYQGATIGVKFPADYFVAGTNYNNSFSTKPSLGWKYALKSGFTGIINYIVHSFEALFPIIIWIFIFAIGTITSRKRGSLSGHKSARKSNKAITPYYLPPRNINPATAFWFWYNGKNQYVFVALLYYWATKGWTHISLTGSPNQRENAKRAKALLPGLGKLIAPREYYVIHENKENPRDASSIDKILLQSFFGDWDNSLDKVKLTENSYSKMMKVLGKLEDEVDAMQEFYTRKKGWFTRGYELTPDGERVFEEMRGYKEYLEKVERDVIEKELKNNPDYLSSILPWAVLFGVETRLLTMCEDMLQQMEWYDSYNGTSLSSHSFASMTSGIKSSIIAPRSSGGGSGGFSGGFSSGGGGGFSGGGGGGGGGGSR